MSSPDPTMAQISRRMLSAKAEQFTESVIREMTRLALKHGAVNLSQGFPDFAAPERSRKPRDRPLATHQPVRHYLGREAAARRIVKSSSARKESNTIRSAKSRFAAAPPRR